MSLSSRAILVSFHAPMWDPKAQDKTAANEMERTAGTSPQTVKVYKTILKSETLKQLRSIRGDAYLNVHSRLTLPWVYKGPAILPIGLFPEYKTKMEQAIAHELPIREKFLYEYPSLVENAKNDLGSLYDSSLYPGVEKLRSKFSFSYNAQPIPDSTDFRVNDPDLKDSYEMVLEGAKLAAMREAYGRLHSTVSHMAERLRLYNPEPGEDADGKKLRVQHPFHESTVNNLKELVEIMPALNVTDDTTLAQLAERAKEKLAYFDAISLRESDGIRRSVQEEAERILADMAPHYTPE